MDRLGAGEHTEPGKRINLLENATRFFRNRRAPYSVKAITSGDEIAINALYSRASQIGEIRLIALEVIGRDVGGFVNDDTPHLVARVIQIAGDLGLAVDGDRSTARQRFEIDPLDAPIEGKVDTAMHSPLPVEPFPDTGGAQHVGQALFEHTGADATQHIITGALFEDNAIDAVAMKDLAEQESGRSATDDPDLGFHFFSFSCRHHVLQAWPSCMVIPVSWVCSLFHFIP